MVSDRRGPTNEPFEIYSDNEVILTWRPAPPPDTAPEDEERQGA